MEKQIVGDLMDTGKSKPPFTTSGFEILFKFKLKSGEGMAEAIDRINQTKLFEEYYGTQEIAPKRGENPKLEIFQSSHKGILPSKDGDFERHLEGALWNQGMVKIFPQTSNGDIQLLDYQFPLNDQQRGPNLKVDLVGVSTGGGNFTVIELKVSDSKGKVNDSPLSALIQALGYTAIIEANLEFIKVALDRKREENPNDERWHIPSLDDKLGIMLLAPCGWWFETFNNYGENWKQKFNDLRVSIKEVLGIETECYTLENITKNHIEWENENKPTLPTKVNISVQPI